MSSKKTKDPARQLKTIKRLKKLLLTAEILFGVLILFMGIIVFVPSVKAEIIKGLASVPVGQKIISWFGNEAYAESVFDADFDNNKLKTNALQYNYFVMYGVDSRQGEVDASNSDSILIVSIHNTTGKVKMASVYRDTMVGIYDNNGTLTKYFKVNSLSSLLVTSL